jgi:hypothetical protein
MTPLHLQLVSTLAPFGPLFIFAALIHPIAKIEGWQGGLAMTLAFCGVSMTSIALGVMSRELVCLRQRLEATLQIHTSSTWPVTSDEILATE